MQQQRGLSLPKMTMRERYAGLFRGSQTSMQTYTPKTNVPSAVRSAIAVIH